MRNSLLVISFFAAVFTACSFASPSVALPKIQRLYSRNGKGAIVEQLALFVLIADKDGLNDYKSMCITENATGLEWQIYREDTVFLKESSSSYEWRAGSNKFIYPRRFFPKGEYTVTVSDLADNQTSTVFTLSEAKPFTFDPFSFSFEYDKWTVTQHENLICTRFSLILLGSDMQPLPVQPVTLENSEHMQGTIAELQAISADCRYVQCLGENTDSSIGFLSNPLKIPHNETNVLNISRQP